MSRFGKPDNMGRSSGKLAGAQRRLLHPPKGKPWTWLTRDLLDSHAWRRLSINGFRLMSFLLMESCNHAGKGNGQLKATHEQLKAYGMSAEAIRPTIIECVALGLIEHTQGGMYANTNQPSLFQLTFYAIASTGEAPSNRWQYAKPKIRKPFGNPKHRTSETRSIKRKPRQGNGGNAGNPEVSHASEIRRGSISGRGGGEWSDTKPSSEQSRRGYTDA